MAHAPQVRLARALVVASLAFIAAMTLVPEVDGGAIDSPLCLACGTRGGTDLLLNVLLFVPLGAALAALGVPQRGCVLLVMLVSAIVELLQLTLVSGRDPSMGDFVNNTMGGALGAFVMRTRGTWMRPGPGAAGRLALAGALGWAGILMVSAHALRPVPTAAEYFGQIRPVQPAQFDVFPGLVLGAAAGGLPMANGPLPPGQQGALRDSAVLTAEVLAPGAAWRRVAPIAAVVDRQRQEIALLGQRRDALLFRARTGAAGLRLSQPYVALPAVFTAAGRAGCARPGAPLTVRGVLVAGTITVSARGGGCAFTVSARMRLSHGWMLVLPFRYQYPGAATSPLSALWLSGVVAPWSYWTACAARGSRARRRALAGFIAALVGGMLLWVPAASGLPAATWWEWASVAFGVATGWWLASRTGGAYT